MTDTAHGSATLDNTTKITYSKGKCSKCSISKCGCSFKKLKKALKQK